MNVIRISTIALLASMALTGCGRGANVTEEDWKLAFDKGVDIRHGNTWVVRGMTAEYKLGDRLVNTQAYGKHSFKEERIKDGFGKGKKWTITYTDPALPVLTQTFYLYDDYLLTDISVASASLIRCRAESRSVLPCKACSISDCNCGSVKSSRQEREAMEAVSDAANRLRLSRLCPSKSCP